MRAPLALAAAALAGSCAEPGPAPPPPLPPFELFPVVAPAVAELEARVTLPPAESELAPAELEEETRGLVTFLAGAQPALRESAVLDLVALGEAAVPTLATVAVSDAAPPEERAAAVELLGALDGPRAGAQLLSLCETAGEGWVRSHAAWRLSQGSQDWVVPRLALRMKYETDHECVVWMARALANFANLSGLLGLENVAENGPDERVRALAAGQLAEIVGSFDAAELERAGGAATAAGLRWAWSRWDGEPNALFREPERSDRYRLEVWRWIDRLDEFQLRGVDDARFVLSRLGPTAALQLARALHDESRYVRVHGAQCLERIGPRASAAGPELVRALGDAELAPSAAGALGRVGHPDGEPALAACTARGRDLGLRVAAARALGSLGLSSSVAALEELLQEDEPVDLRQAAAESLVYCGAGERVAARLCDFLESAVVDPASSGAALRWFLAQRARQGSPAAGRVLAEWDALAAEPGVIETPEEIAGRWASRAGLVRAALPELLP